MFQPQMEAEKVFLLALRVESSTMLQNELVRGEIISWTPQFIFVRAGGIEGRERLKKQQRKGEMWEAETASIN